MRIKFICMCGLENHNKEDWLSHWKYGRFRPAYMGGCLPEYPKLRAIWFFLNTKVKFSK